jgi:5-(carboxyamino)imidazole ribonucleotide synthase
MNIQIGILGGGQLGRMLGLAAVRMGLRVRFLTPTDDGPTEGIGETVVADWKDPDVLAAFADGCDVITSESEWAPSDVLEAATDGRVPVFPRPQTLRLIRHKGRQKVRLAEVGLPMPDFVCARSLEEAENAARTFGFPLLFKAYRGSYDGYGNVTVREEGDILGAWDKLADPDGLLVEAWAPFVRELAVMVARRPDGGHVAYPVVETEQRDHRCHAVLVPAASSSEVQRLAMRTALAAVDTVDAVGVMGVELFEMADGRILVNELAPRPHNTGHYTIEACHTSQFENHLRAILDWPLGDPSLQVPAAAMVNVLGRRAGRTSLECLPSTLEVKGAAVHLYGKRDVKERRKMGHVTAVADSVAAARQIAEESAALLKL